MLDILQLGKSYGPNLVLNNISFSMFTGIHAGLVGANGVGKSTLLKIIAGLETADSGEIKYSSSTKVGYLPQNLPNVLEQTIDELLMHSLGGLLEIKARINQLEHLMENAKKKEISSILAEYSQLTSNFQENDGDNIDHKISIIIEGLGIGYLERSRRIETLSGGEKTRINLATVLLKAPDLLLLDEPTNNLDEKSLDWLESYLRNYKGVILAASHDRQFLNNLASVIFEIDEHSHELKKYHGNYDNYKASKALERVKWEQDYQYQQEEIKELKKTIKVTTHSPGHSIKSRDNDKILKGFKRGRIDHLAARLIRNAEERLKRLQDNPIPKPPKPLRIKPNLLFQDIKSSEVIRVEGVSKSFGDRNILKDISFSLKYNSRVVIIGPNGTGKTTLLRIITGQIQPDDGNIRFAPSVRLGVLSQEPELTSPEKTLLE